MQIKKLEIAGFKSFGTRRSFVFQPGITAIVGPNGSGKSNVADAIRWVLGEQKNRRLRITKSEDLIFYGTTKKPQASLAEVTLLLDNSSGGLDIDVSEIELSRRLLRSGESEYRLNGRKSRKVDIEELLAKAGFGIEAYTVIGQGTIDQLLTATGAERKMLFDEASGIRQYDLRRSSARRDLIAATSNLARVTDILAELSPTVRLLEKQTSSLEKAAGLRAGLEQSRKDYLSVRRSELQAHQEQNKTSKRTAQTELSAILEQIQQLHSELQTTTLTDTSVEKQTKELKALELERDSLTQKMLLSQNELEVLLTNNKELTPSVIEQRSVQRDLDNASSNLEAIEKSLIELNRKTQDLQAKINAITDELAGLTGELNSLQRVLQKSQKKEFVSHALGLVQSVRVQLRKGSARQEIDKTMHKLGSLLELAQEDDSASLATDLSRIQSTIGKLMASREEVVELQTNKTIRLRSLELDMASCKAQIEAYTRQLEEMKQSTDANTQREADIVIRQKSLSEQKDVLHVITQQIKTLREALYTSRTQPDTKGIGRLEHLASDKTRLELELTRLDGSAMDIQRQLDEVARLGVEWFGKMPRLATTLPVSVPTLAQIDALQAELTAIEDIDPELIIQAQESKERVDFLEHQQSDLNQAIVDTQSLIASLELDMKKRFTTSFKKLNKIFGEYFAKLFLGGSAMLELLEQDGEYGVEIVVQPPGKRSKNIAALSGGEKALASIALLAAIILTNPSPFIVLDEVDAALDDENSSRFTKVLQELASHLQLLVVTHNHETMQAADNLFGITSTPQGDSEVLSLALQAAEAYATT